MKLSDVVAMALTGDGSLVGRDSKGVYVEFDTIVMPLNGRDITLYMGRLLVGTIELSNMVKDNDTVTVTGIEGRVRVTS